MEGAARFPILGELVQVAESILVVMVVDVQKSEFSMLAVVVEASVVVVEVLVVVVVVVVEHMVE